MTLLLLLRRLQRLDNHKLSGFKFEVTITHRRTQLFGFEDTFEDTF